MTTQSKDKPAPDTAKAFATLGKEAFESAISMSAQAAAEGYKNAAQVGREQLEATKTGCERFAAFGKGSLDAYSAASVAVLSGFEAYCEELADCSEKAVAQSGDLMQKVCAAKSPQEMIELQIEAMNAFVGRSIAEATRLNKLATDTLTRCVQPIKDVSEVTSSTSS